MTYIFVYKNDLYKIIYTPIDNYGMPGYAIDFQRNGKSIGDAIVSIKLPSFLNESQEEINIEEDSKNMYVMGIKVKGSEVGHGVGKIFINMLFDAFKVSKLWGYSSNHPYWNKIATNTGLYQNYCPVYTLVKEQIPLN